MSIILDSKIPEGPLAEKWSKHKADIKVVSLQTNANSISLSWALVWVAVLLRRLSASWVIM